MSKTMNNYLSFDSFTTAAHNAPLRKVLAGGVIYLDGRRYEHEDLLPHVGRWVRTFSDLDGADAVCFTPFDEHFICNAHNPELWSEMLGDAGLTPNA